MDNLITIINELLTDIGLDEVKELKKEWSLKNDLQIDSISKAELIVKIKSTYGADICLLYTSPSPRD